MRVERILVTLLVVGCFGFLALVSGAVALLASLGQGEPEVRYCALTGLNDVCHDGELTERVEATVTSVTQPDPASDDEVVVDVTFVLGGETVTAEIVSSVGAAPPSVGGRTVVAVSPDDPGLVALVSDLDRVEELDAVEREQAEPTVDPAVWTAIVCLVLAVLAGVLGTGHARRAPRRARSVARFPAPGVNPYLTPPAPPYPPSAAYPYGPPAVQPYPPSGAYPYGPPPAYPYGPPPVQSDSPSPASHGSPAEAPPDSPPAANPWAAPDRP